jgi:TPR repeat protein
MLIIVRNSISIILLLVLLVTSAVAADLQKGMEAALRGDYAKALAEWLPLAEQGNFKAQYNIGVYYDKALAKGEQEKAEFEQDSFIAALSNTNGNDTLTILKERLKIATDPNELITLKLYKNVLTSIKDAKTSAVFWFRKAAKQGYGPAEYNLGNMYYYGKGLKRDYSQAYFWYKKSTENNFTGGQYNLGTMYYKGLGVKQDYSKAYYWLKKASDRGDDKAQNLLAYFYYSGLGVEKNVEKTLNLYKKSAEQGNLEALNNLGVFYENGFVVEQNYNRAFFWYKKSAENNFAIAQSNLGNLYWRGKIKAENFISAYKWFTLAADQGLESAIEMKNNVKKYMTQAQINEAKLKVKEWKAGKSMD